MGGFGDDFAPDDDDDEDHDDSYQEMKKEDIKIDSTSYKMERDDSIKFETTET